jgi:hypothetical protein
LGETLLTRAVISSAEILHRSERLALSVANLYTVTLARAGSPIRSTETW